MCENYEFFDMQILAHFSIILSASKLKISAEMCDITNFKKGLQYHYISDKSEHTCTFEKRKANFKICQNSTRWFWNLDWKIHIDTKMMKKLTKKSLCFSPTIDMRILAHFSMILPASKLKISAEMCDITN